MVSEAVGSEEMEVGGVDGGDMGEGGVEQEALGESEVWGA